MKSFDFNNNEIRKLDSGLFQHISSSILGIYLNDNKIQALNVDLFKGCTSLSYISLNKNEIKDLNAGLFEECSSLEEIHFDYNEIKHLKEGVFKGCSRLKKISFNNNRIREVDLNYLLSIMKAKTSLLFRFADLKHVNSLNDFFLIKISISSNSLQRLPFFDSTKEVQIDLRNNVSLIDLNLLFSLLFSIFTKNTINKSAFDNCNYFKQFDRLSKVDNDKLFLSRDEKAKETLFLLCFNKKNRNLNNKPLICDSFRDKFQKFDQYNWFLLDFLLDFDEDSVSNEFLINLDSFIRNELRQNPSLVNLDFQMKSPNSVERLCQRNSLPLLKSLLNLNFLSDQDEREKGRIDDPLEFCLNINFEECFKIVFENNNERIAIHLLNILRHLAFNCDINIREKKKRV